eukprot:m.308922 g.308922  ORF g.308922 m.308922 type:complete len:589 (+) comp45072_c0_seq1:107-1873(+)
MRGDAEKYRMISEDGTNNKASRRCFGITLAILLVLVVIGVLGGLYGVLKSRRCNDGCSTSDFEIQDFIIVGGGPGGAYAAYWISNNDSLPDAKILLLEATDRIGGRLYSVDIPGVDAVAEAGGMRYIPKAQPHVERIISELNIESQVFEMDETNAERPYFLRGHLLRQKDLDNSTVLDMIYSLDDSERNKSPSDIYHKYYNLTVPEEDRLKIKKDPHFRKEASSIYGNPLFDYGQVSMFNLANASSEAGPFFQDTNGYSFWLPPNPSLGGNLVDPGETSGASGYLTPVKGMSTIPMELVANFTNHTNSRVKKNSTVEAIKDCSRSEKLYCLAVRDSNNGEKTTYCARKVILSLTRSQLKRIDWAPLHDAENLRSIDAVASQKASKFFLVYSQPWWESLDFNLQKGRTISTLQTRQTFYFSAKSPSSHSLLMSYNDGSNADFWGALANPEFTTYPGSMNFLYPLTEQLVVEAVQQIKQNHGMESTEEPLQGFVMYWNHQTAPRVVKNYGLYMPSEAWHLWKPGYNITEIMKAISQLDPEQDVFIAGSAYSNNQGWVEGAMETVEDVLTEKLGFKPKTDKTKRVSRSMSP